MDTRTKRFWNGVFLGERSPSVTPTPAVSGWTFRALDSHPIDGWKMVYAYSDFIYPLHYPGKQRPVDWPTLGVLAVLTGVRMGDAVSDIEMSAGLMMYRDLDEENRPAVAPHDHRGHVHSKDTAPATKHTCQIRVKEHLATGRTSFGIELLRGISLTGQPQVHMIHFHAQMLPGWADGVAEQVESAISGRTATLGTGDRLVLGVPWLHEFGEMVIDMDVSKLVLARAAVISLLTPPAPDPAE